MSLGDLSQHGPKISELHQPDGTKKRVITCGACGRICCELNMGGREPVDVVCSHCGHRHTVESALARCPKCEHTYDHVTVRCVEGDDEIPDRCPKCGGELVKSSGPGPGGGYRPRPQWRDWLAKEVATDLDKTSVALISCGVCGRECWAVCVGHEENRVSCPHCVEVHSISIEYEREIRDMDPVIRIGLPDSYGVPIKSLVPEHLMGFWGFLSRIPILGTICDKIYTAVINHASSVRGVFVQRSYLLEIVWVGGKTKVSQFLARDLTKTVCAFGTCIKCGMNCKAVCILGQENHLICPHCGGVNRIRA